MHKQKADATAEPTSPVPKLNFGSAGLGAGLSRQLSPREEYQESLDSARSQEAAEVKEPGFAPAYARFVVKRTCCAFWLSLTVSLLLSVVGIVIAMQDAQAKGQSSILHTSSIATARCHPR